MTQNFKDLVVAVKQLPSRELDRLHQYIHDWLNHSPPPTEIYRDVSRHGYEYIASTNTDRFHRPDCKWVRNFTENTPVVTFKDHEEATGSRFKPC